MCYVVRDQGLIMYIVIHLGITDIINYTHHMHTSYITQHIARIYINVLYSLYVAS